MALHGQPGTETLLVRLRKEHNRLPVSTANAEEHALRLSNAPSMTRHTSRNIPSTAGSWCPGCGAI